ncbi:MAG: hypothetical protein NT170_01455 [Candidatus Moranbacteria bacterium]|nr:hypothetical protein [Candidatus Moranbacteria bacterium]
MERKNEKSGKEKPRFVNAEKKKRLSEAENKLVVGISPVAGLGVVRVECEPSVVPVQVEHIRIAVAVGYIRNAIHDTARIIRQKRRIAGCILFGSKTPRASRTK